MHEPRISSVFVSFFLLFLELGFGLALGLALSFGLVFAWTFKQNMNIDYLILSRVNECLPKVCFFKIIIVRFGRWLAGQANSNHVPDWSQPSYSLVSLKGMCQ